MDKKFKRKEEDKPLTDFGKPKSTNKRPQLDKNTIREKASK
ncbi:hypothetical protein [Aquimarina sp. SS2-1]